MPEDLSLLERTEEVRVSRVGDQPGPRSGGEHVAFLLFDGFSIIGLSSAIEALHVANRTLGRTEFRYFLYSPRGATSAVSGAGLAFEVRPDAEGIDHADFLVICSGEGVEECAVPSALKARIRRLHRDRVPIGAIGSGAYVLARIGLLEDHRCAVHRGYAGILQEVFPGVRVEDSILEIDRRVMTCAGGIAAMEMMISYIRNCPRAEVAGAVSAITLDHDLCSGLEERQLDLRFGLNGSNQRLSKCIRIMEENIERPLKTREIARRAGMSTRSLQRLFQRSFGEAPTQCYQKIRLDVARRLVRQTSLPMMSIAMATGFSMASRFSKKYKAEFGISPRKDRIASIKINSTI
jgi:transcriptional regulator GlxA family with amidase domain